MAIWIGYRHADRLITYPHPHNLSMSRQPIRMRGGYPLDSNTPISRRQPIRNLSACAAGTPSTRTHRSHADNLSACAADATGVGVPRGLRGVALVPADGGRDAQQHARHSGTAQVTASDGRAGLVIDQSGRRSRVAISRAGHRLPAQPAAQRRAPRARRRGRDTAYQHNQRSRCRTPAS